VKVRWLRSGLADVDAIQNYIARESAPRAFEIASRIRQRAEELAQFPNRGRSGRVSGTRELVPHDLPWILVYRVNPPHIEILRVMHGRQRWPLSI